MWGHDTLAPQVAIEAMNGMKATVRNAAFAPAFFGTPLALLVTAALAVAAAIGAPAPGSGWRRRSIFWAPSP